MGEHERTETDRLDPQPESYTLDTGLAVKVVPLKTRQLFRFMRILTHGAGAALLANGMDFGGSPQEFASRLSAIAMLAIPDAETETMEFLASMCEPAALAKPAKGKELSDKEKEANSTLWDQLNTDMFNPDPLDVIEIIEMIVTNEAADLQALGKKLSRMLEKIRPPARPEETAPLPSPEELSSSSAPSPPSSTSSPPSTDGPTSTSSTSPSADSVPLEPPSVLAGGVPYRSEGP